MKNEVYLTVQEVADHCGVHTQAVYYWINEGRLGCYKFGGRYRIPVAEFEAFKKRSKRDGPSEEATLTCLQDSGC